MKNRVAWIDIAKGLMIIGMVLNHIINYCFKMGVDISGCHWGVFGRFYGVFTMQSFFILSGYTTNFDLDSLTFLKKQIKGLLIPYVSFLLIFTTLEHIMWGEPYIIEMYGEKYFFLVEGYWFLTAMFFAKILVYFMHKILKNKLLETLGGGLLLILGIAISELYSDMPEPSHWHNWFHYRNGLCMTVFLSIGYYLKRYNIVERFGLKITILYCVLYIFTDILNHLGVPFIRYFIAPNYTHYLIPNLSKINGFLLIPSYLLYTVLGSVMVFWISQKINNSKLLEYFGRESLIIYCVHFTLLKISIKTFTSFIPSGVFVGDSINFLLIAVTTLLTSVILAKVFEHRPFNYLIGSF